MKDAFAIQNSRSADGLREIASNLTLEMPRAYTTKEEEQLDQMGRRITLGDSIRASVIERKVLKKVSTKSKSYGPDDFGSAVDKVNSCDLVRMETYKDSPTKLSLKFRSKSEPAHMLLHTLEEKVSKSAENTPEPKRKSFSFRMTPSPKMTRKKFGKQAQELNIPTLTPCQGFLTPSDDLAMRASEQEPFPHQVDIPDSKDVLMHSRLCSVLDQYHLIDQNFNLGALTGVPRTVLEGFLRGETLDGLVPQHRPIVQKLVDCANDLVLEGYFHEDSNETNEREEVAIFNNQELRQFIVVYRGTSGQQIKPIRSKQSRSEPTNLHSEQPVAVLPVFRETYFRSKLESKVFDLLDRLAGKYPFCDVVTTGHSFGGVMATIAALRFAISREMIRVSCHTFGTPKIGGITFRQLANILPNLKVMRIEHVSDQLVHTPDAGTWTHVGHTITLDPIRKPCAMAYKFDKHKPVPKHMLVPRKSEKAQDMSTYVRVLEHCARSRKMWAKSYVGENIGKGVRGHDNEEREVV